MISSGKLSNYTGQARKLDEKLDIYLSSVDRDLQNLWRAVHLLLQYTGVNSANLATNTTVGFTYIPTMVDNPQSTPTNYAGHAAIVFCTSDSSLRIYNSSDTSWKLELLT